MYYLCACAQKPPKTSTKQNGTTKYTSNLAMTNPTFVMNEPEMKQKIIAKKKAPAPPPTIFEQSETLEVQHEAVIAQLDEILEKEAIIDQFDNILNNETIRINDNRKLSAGTLSNMSAMASSTESVVADVHCADVVNTVADPESILFPILSYPTTTNADIPEILNNDNNETSKEILGIDTKEIIISEQNSDEERIENVNELNSEREEAQLEVNNDIQQAFESDTQKNLEETKNENDQDKFTDIKEPENKELKEPLTVNLPPILPPIMEQTIVSSPVPTQETLKTVTLKRVVKEIKKIEPTNNQNASENNLRVGSEEYKNFIRDLDNKLKRTSVLPTFYVAPKKGVMQTKEVVPNENVIEEPIDQVEAKIRLTSFYASKIENPKLLHSSKSVDAKNSNFPIVEHNFSNHKEKMESVFNSINLKKLENLDDKHLKRRLSRSLGVGFAKENDQQSDHQQKMSDLFKDIKAMRKE